MNNPIQFQNTGWATRPILISEAVTEPVKEDVSTSAPTAVPWKNFVYFVKRNGLNTYYEQKGFDNLVHVHKSLGDVPQLANLRNALFEYIKEIKDLKVGDSHLDNVKIRRITEWIEAFVRES